MSTQLEKSAFEDYQRFYFDLKLRIAKQLSLVLVAVFILLGILFFRDGLNSYVYPFIFGGVVALFCYIHLIRTQQPNLSYSIYIVSAVATCSFTLFFLPEDLHWTDFMWRVIILVLSFIGAAKIISFLLLLYFSIEIVLFTQGGMVDNFKTFHFDSPLQIWGITFEMIILFSILFYLLHNFVLLNTKAKEKLVEALLTQEEINSELAKKNEEKVLLVKEIHHRVKNNLQIIISLLRLQKEELKSEEAKQHFSEAINRVMSMSTIHQRLYQQDNLENIVLEDYIRDMVRELKNIYALNKSIAIDLSSNGAVLNLKTVVPFGLILNELLTNTFKHAYSLKDAGIIRIALEHSGNELTFHYSDDGDWKESLSEHSGFGLELISILTEQINGSYCFVREENESAYHFQFQLDNETV